MELMNAKAARELSNRSQEKKYKMLRDKVAVAIKKAATQGKKITYVRCEVRDRDIAESLGRVLEIAGYMFKILDIERYNDQGHMRVTGLGLEVSWE